MIQTSPELVAESSTLKNLVLFGAALLLVLANGFFVASEFALVSLRRSRITMLADGGSKRAKGVLRVLDNLGTVISATQLGITISSLALGWIGEDALDHLIHPILDVVVPASVSEAASHTISIVIAFVTITYLHIVLGELVPKTLSLERAETVALFVARPIELFYTLFRIPIAVLKKSGTVIGRAIGLKMTAEHAQAYTEEEIRYLIDASHKGGHLEAGEREMIHNIFEFTSETVRDCMIPRTEVAAASASSSVGELAALFESTGLSRMPVVEGNLDSVVGVLHGKDVLRALLKGTEDVARTLMRPAIFVPPSAQLDHVLARMRGTGNHLAIVVDEHGSLEGIVTLEDIIEEIVGEIRDEFDEGSDEPVAAQPDGSFVIDATIPIRALNRRLDIRIPESGRYATLAGFVLSEAGTIPKAGQVIDFANARFVVESVVRNRVVSVRFHPNAAGAGEAPAK
jgi:CBS domain containing-hemolysin-like protein